MSSALTEFQARQSVQRMHQLRNQVDLFTTHARMLRLTLSLDGLALLQEADTLLRSLKSSRVDFENLQANLTTLSRRLSPAPPIAGGPPPAAQWGSEFRAGVKQFARSAEDAENEIRQLYGAANAQLHSPTRTPTAPDNIVDVIVNLADIIGRWVEYRKRARR